MTDHDLVLRELTIIAMRFTRLARDFHELECALRKSKSSGTLSSIEKGVSRAIKTPINQDGAQPYLEGLPW